MDVSHTKLTGFKLCPGIFLSSSDEAMFHLRSRRWLSHNTYVLYDCKEALVHLWQLTRCYNFVFEHEVLCERAEEPTVLGGFRTTTAYITLEWQRCSFFLSYRPILVHDNLFWSLKATGIQTQVQEMKECYLIIKKSLYFHEMRCIQVLKRKMNAFGKKRYANSWLPCSTYCSDCAQN